MAQEQTNTSLYLGLAAVGLLAVGGAVVFAARGRGAGRARARERLAARRWDEHIARLEKDYAVRVEQVSARDAVIRLTVKGR